MSIRWKAMLDNPVFPGEYCTTLCRAYNLFLFVIVVGIVLQTIELSGRLSIILTSCLQPIRYFVEVHSRLVSRVIRLMIAFIYDSMFLSMSFIL